MNEEVFTNLHGNHLIYIPCSCKGQGQKDQQTNKASPIEIFHGDSMFFRVTEDKEGNIWVGTLQGVITYDGKSIHYYSDVES